MACSAFLPQMVMVSTQEAKPDVDIDVHRQALQHKGGAPQVVDLRSSAGVPVVEIGLRDMPPGQQADPSLRAQNFVPRVRD